MRRLRVIRWAWAAAALAVLASAAPAPAFYWYGEPGSRTRRPPTIVPPDDERPGNPPVVPGLTPPPLSVPPQIPPGEPVPEPATAVVALVGLGAVAARRALRRS